MVASLAIPQIGELNHQIRQIRRFELRAGSLRRADDGLAATPTALAPVQLIPHRTQVDVPWPILRNRHLAMLRATLERRSSD